MGPASPVAVRRSVCSHPAPLASTHLCCSWLILQKSGNCYGSWGHAAILVLLMAQQILSATAPSFSIMCIICKQMVGRCDAYMGWTCEHCNPGRSCSTTMWLGSNKTCQCFNKGNLAPVGQNVMNRSLSTYLQKHEAAQTGHLHIAS